MKFKVMIKLIKKIFICSIELKQSNSKKILKFQILNLNITFKQFIIYLSIYDR